MSNITVSHCEAMNGCDAAMYLTLADNALVEYCSFHGQDSLNPAQFHTNVIYCGQTTNSSIERPVASLACASAVSRASSSAT
jgi:hypothetical protein